MGTADKANAFIRAASPETGLHVDQMPEVFEAFYAMGQTGVAMENKIFAGSGLAGRVSGGSSERHSGPGRPAARAAQNMKMQEFVLLVMRTVRHLLRLQGNIPQKWRKVCWCHTGFNGDYSRSYRRGNRNRTAEQRYKWFQHTEYKQNCTEHEC